jgi:hypothetical protein
MKKIAIVLVLFLLVGIVGVFAQDSFRVDISKLPGATPEGTVRSTSMTPSKGGGAPYAYFKIDFPEGTFPADLPWANYNRIRVVFKYYRANGAEIRQGNGNAMVVIAYDPNGDLEGPPQSAGPNTPVKIFNVGGNQNAGGPVSSEGGSRITPLTRAPGAILLQRNGNSAVASIELVELTFFKQ